MLKVFCLSNHKGHLHSTEAMTKVWNAFWFLHQKNSRYWRLVHVVLPLPWLPTNTISKRKFWSRQSRHHPWCRKERVVRALKPSAFTSKLRMQNLMLCLCYKCPRLGPHFNVTGLSVLLLLDTPVGTFQISLSNKMMDPSEEHYLLALVSAMNLSHLVENNYTADDLAIILEQVDKQF